MVKSLSRILFILIALNVQNVPLISQAERYSEDEIICQNKFIDATKEKLLGHEEKAIKLFLELLREDRDNHVVAWELAKLYNENKDYTNALNYCDKAISFEKNNVWYWQLKSNILEANQQYGPAAQVYNELIQLTPSNPKNYYKRAESLKSSGDFEEAIKAYNETEKKFGIQEMSSKAKFQLFQQSGNQEKALLELIKLSNAYPNNVRFLNNLAGFLQKNGDEKKALVYYKKILNLDPDHPQANLYLAGNLQEPEDEGAYLKSIQALINNNNIPIEPKLKELLPYLEQFVDQKDEKLGESLLFVANLLKNAHPEDARAYALYADVLIHNGRMEEAIRKYNKTLSIDDSKLSVWEQLMFALSVEERYDALQETCEDALDLFPNQAICYYYLGMAQMHQNLLSEAKSNFQEARFISSKNPRLKAMAEVMLSKVYIKELNWDKATDLLDKAMETFPASEIEVLELKGDIFFQKGEIETGLEYWQKSKDSGNQSDKLSRKILQKQFIE
jgi:tetratricopeptide (TPR) repeat protein